MKQISLKNRTPSGSPLEAIYLPEMGMNMISFKRGDIEVIDQSTWNLFDERFAGLGPLIGPHFHHRKPEIIKPIPDESLFPHIARLRAKGIQEPFSHGIARYASWKTEFTETSIRAVITGKDTWNGIALSQLEGQEFRMTLHVDLTPSGLKIHLAVASDTDSLVGIHYYYRLPQGRGKIKSFVQATTSKKENWKKFRGFGITILNDS